MTEPGSPYPNLFRPIRVGARTLANRIVMGSMHTRIELMDRAVDREAAFFAERARGGTGLIITGGFSPNAEGGMEEDAPRLTTAADAARLSPIADAVHAEGVPICLQILHAGRYAKYAAAVGASDIQAPINRFAPRALTADEVDRTVDDYVSCAALAQSAGFDGVEIMGSEGYLITQFLCTRTNTRDDAWGGPFENRMRFPLEILRRTRQRVGNGFLLIYRISALDLVDGGLTGAEIVRLAREVERAGADMLTMGIGWHEARIPTIAHMVPRGAWRFASRPIKDAVAIPVAATNRINTPEVAEDILARGDADLVAMARPLLADPAFAAKARDGRADEINTCIACNQACLDLIFRDRTATCLVNPRAAREIEFPAIKAARPRRIAVVGAGPAGLSCAVTAAERGHAVTLFDSAAEIGGQLNMAKRIPGKEEFFETIRYYRARLARLGVDIRLNTRPGASDLAGPGFDSVVVATGVRPRALDLEGAGDRRVVSYADILTGRAVAGRRVAIVGAGGIGFDVAVFLTGGAPAAGQPLDAFLAEWGVDAGIGAAGGLAATVAPAMPDRDVTILQRKPTRPGRDLGLTTGWAIRAELDRRGVRTIAGAEYRRIDAAGLHVAVDGAEHIVEADSIVVCIGQEPSRILFDELRGRGVDVRVIGGAENAAGLDAMRAIDQGMRVASAF